MHKFRKFADADIVLGRVHLSAHSTRVDNSAIREVPGYLQFVVMGKTEDKNQAIALKLELTPWSNGIRIKTMRRPGKFQKENGTMELRQTIPQFVTIFDPNDFIPCFPER